MELYQFTNLQWEILLRYKLKYENSSSPIINECINNFLKAHYVDKKIVTLSELNIFVEWLSFILYQESEEKKEKKICLKDNNKNIRERNEIERILQQLLNIEIILIEEEKKMQERKL